MSSERPLGHDEELAGLWRAAAEERLAHALLLRGPRGVGKFLAARWLARGLLCERGPGEPCDTCGPCKRARTGNHPDLFVVDAVAAGFPELTVAFVADRKNPPPGGYTGPSIASFLRLKAHEGGWRIVLVREAERMNDAAQSAFLKTLEEPGSRTLLVIETSAPEKLLTTVRSRLVDVELAALSDGQCREVLARNGIEEDEADVLAPWCRGAPGRALTLAARGAPAMRDAIVAVLAGEREPAAAAEELSALEGDFPGKTPSQEARERVRTLLDVGLELLLDIERAAAGVPEETLAHGALATRLAGLPAPRRRRCMEEWTAARQDVDLNLSPAGLALRALDACREESPTSLPAGGSGARRAR